MASQRQLRQHDDQGATVPAWTVDSVRSLGLTTTIDKAASILGISRTKAYALAKDGDFPIKLVRAGRRYLVPTPALIDLLTGGRVEHSEHVGISRADERAQQRGTRNPAHLRFADE